MRNCRLFTNLLNPTTSMAFSISNASNEGVHLDRKMIVFPAQLFTLVGVIFMIVGLLPLLYLSTLEPAFRAIMTLLSIIGLVAIITGFRYPIEQKKSIPDSLFFDNARGRIRIYHRVSETPEAFIYFNEIKGFYMDQIQETKTRNRYVVLLKKVDGGEWDLYHTMSYSAANRFLQILRDKVTLDTSPNRVESSALPVSRVKVDQSEQKLTISWRNSLRENLISMLIWAAAVGAATVYAFNYIFILDGRSTFIYEAIVFGIFIVIAGINFYQLYRASSIVHTIAVNEDSITVSERTGKGVNIQTQTFRFPQIFSIYYKFNSANPESKLFFVKQSDEDERRDMLDVIAKGKTAAKEDFFKNQFAVNFKDLTTLEVLSIESYIQDFVRNRTRTEIL
jgi:hypothetical protein